MKSGNFVAEQGRDGVGESVDKQFIEGDKVKLHGIHTRGTTKVWDLEGVEGIVESTTIWAGAVNPTAATVRMTKGYYMGRLIIGLDFHNLTAIATKSEE